MKMNKVSVLTNFCNIFSSPQSLKQFFPAWNYQKLWVDSKTLKTLEWFRELWFSFTWAYGPHPRGTYSTAHHVYHGSISPPVSPGLEARSPG